MKNTMSIFLKLISCAMIVAACFELRKGKPTDAIAFALVAIWFMIATAPDFKN